MTDAMAFLDTLITATKDKRMKWHWCKESYAAKEIWESINSYGEKCRLYYVRNGRSCIGVGTAAFYFEKFIRSEEEMSKFEELHSLMPFKEVPIKTNLTLLDYANNFLRE